MAKNEPNKPEDVKTVPAKKTPTKEKAISESPPGSGSDVLAPSDDVVIPFEKINEIVTEKHVAAKAQEKSDQKMPQAKAEQKGKSPSSQSEKSEKTNKAPPTKDSSDTDELTAWEKEESSISSKPKHKPKQEKKPETAAKKPAGKAEKAAAAPEVPPPPTDAPRAGTKEEIVYLNLSELHAFKNHPFSVRNDEEMQAMVESVKDKGVTQPAIARPCARGGYEIVSGHRRHKASELAGFTNMPVIVRDLTDEQAITQMVEDNTNQRENILPSERAKALKMQLDAIKKQGARTGNGQRSNEVVALRNKMTVKQVQRYIKLNDLVPDLAKMADEKKIGFTPSVELAHIKPENQRYIAVAIEGQAAPSLSQAKRLRELDQKGLLQPDMIDGILLEEKKEVDKVIISSAELSEYFGKDKTPREMKDQIMQLLDEWKGQQKDIKAPEKKAAIEK